MSWLDGLVSAVEGQVNRGRAKSREFSHFLINVGGFGEPQKVTFFYFTPFLILRKRLIAAVFSRMTRLPFLQGLRSMKHCQPR